MYWIIAAIVIVIIIIVIVAYFVLSVSHFAEDEQYGDTHYLDFYRDINNIENMIIAFDNSIIAKVPEMTEAHRKEIYEDIKVIVNKYQLEKTYGAHVTRYLLSGGVDDMMYDIKTSLTHVLLQYRNETEVNSLLEPAINLRRDILQVIGKTPIRAVTFSDLMIKKDTRAF